MASHVIVCEFERSVETSEADVEFLHGRRRQECGLTNVQDECALQIRPLMVKDSRPVFAVDLGAMLCSLRGG